MTRIRDLYCMDMRENQVPECKSCSEFFSAIDTQSYKFCPHCGEKLSK